LKLKIFSIFILALTFAVQPIGSTAQAQKSKSSKVKKRKPNRKQSRGGGVRQKFDRAQKLYNAKKFGEAAIAYDQIIRRYPGHEPSLIQLAKSLYKLDRYRDAYNVFTKINPQYLDPETSYQYGWSFYKNKQYEGALYGFKRVPKGYSLFDLANYYGAISAIKMKEYDIASDMLDKAMVLPDKLAKSKNLYRKHVQALQVMKKRSELSKERKAERGRLSGKSKKTPAPVAAADDGKYKHKGTMGVYKAAKISHKRDKQKIDYHGYNRKIFESEKTAFQAFGGPLYPLPITLGDRQAAFGTQIFLSVEKSIKEGTEQRVIVDETDQDLVRIQEQDLGTSDSNAGMFDVAPFIEIPLEGDVWMVFGGGFFFYYPEFERGNRFGTRKGYLSLNGPFNKLSITGEMAYSEALNSKTEPTTITTSGSGSASYRTEGGTSISFSMKHKNFDYLFDGQSGPDSSTAASLNLGQGLPFGFSVSGSGSAEQQTNYINYAIPSFGTVSADGTVLTGSAKLSITPAPISWFNFSVTQLVSQTIWDVANPNAVDQWELTVPETIDQFTMAASINLDF
jgi:tetratricopeptide (TPR) repeat protein